MEYQPDILGYSVMTGSQRGYFDLNLRIRQAVNPLRESAGKKPVFSVFGGPHPTFFPETINEPGVDGVCIGEGEGAMVDLANALASRNGAFNTDIPNWWFNVEGEIVKNPPRPLIHELSALPHPDRALIYEGPPISRREQDQVLHDLARLPLCVHLLLQSRLLPALQAGETRLPTGCR